MTSPVDMLNIPPDILNISPTSSTSPPRAIALPGTPSPRIGLEDVEDVEPKKNVPATYLLCVVTRGCFLLRPVRAMEGPVPTRMYLALNILNIPKTWHATSPSVLLARASTTEPTAAVPPCADSAAPTPPTHSSAKEPAMTQPLPVHSRLTEVTFSALPEDNVNHGIYSVTVAWRGDDRYAVKRLSQCLGADGTWDYEPSPSNREDGWLAEHRFDYDTACRLASEACRHVTVNGLTVADALRRAGER